MRPFSGLGIGLGLVFGFLFFALVAELYYLLWWKKRIVSEEEEHKSRTKQFLNWRRPSSVHSSRDPDGNARENPDPEIGSGKDPILKTFGEEDVEAELRRAHNLAGPPRFLFTIKEETKEDMETDTVKSVHQSLGDLLMTVDSPLLTLISSPMTSSPLLDSSVSETELAKLSCSPPPKFKFLRDAEEKLCRRLKEEAEKRANS